MKNRYLAIIICCLLIAAFVLGAAGVIRFDGESGQESNGTDRLIGVLITGEYLDLFDNDRYLQENLDKLVNGGTMSDEELAAYSGRLYAEPAPEADDYEGYQFEGIEGIRFIAPFIDGEEGRGMHMFADEGIADTHTHLSVTDEGESVLLNGTVYVSEQAFSGSLYLNPVFQSQDGAVYAVAGDGIFLDDGTGQGIDWSQKISAEQSQDSGGARTYFRTEVEIAVRSEAEPVMTAVVELGAGSEVLDRREFSPGAFPDHIEVNTGTQYIIVEEISESGIRRSLFQRDDTVLYGFYGREDGILVKQDCEIIWND